MPEVINRGRWSPGQSGNPEGYNKRALTETLQMLSEFDSYDDLANKRLLAQLVWEGLVSGQIMMVGGRTMELKGKDWVELVKWFYSHIDGTYRDRLKEDEKAAKAKPQKVGVVYEMPPQEKPMQDKREEGAKEARPQLALTADGAITLSTHENAVRPYPYPDAALTLNPSPEGEEQRTSPPAPLQNGEGNTALTLNPSPEGEGRNEVEMVNTQREPPPETWHEVIQRRWEAAKAQRDAAAMPEPERENEGEASEADDHAGLVKMGEDWVTPETAREMLMLERYLLNKNDPG